MPSRLVKEGDVVIYKNPQSYSHNPVLEFLPTGELACVFREAPRRRMRTHIDTRATASMITSTDRGRTWDPSTRRVIFERAGWGVQDPSLRKLSDGTLICNFFAWCAGGEKDFPVDHAWLQSCGADHYSWTIGTYTIRSTDGGRTWEPPVKVNSPTGDATSTSDPIIELANGDLLLPLEGALPGERERTMVARSRDKGRSWDEAVTTAIDPLGQFSFHETGLLALASGKVIGMHRTALAGDHSSGGHFLFQTDSTDGGRTWTPPRRTPVWGHPAHLLQLASGSILLVYGYRRPPYGVRACLSHDEGKTWDIRNELILRNDGIDGDLGYPTSIQFPDGTILTSWYMNEMEKGDATLGGEFFSCARPQAFLGGTFIREDRM